MRVSWCFTEERRYSTNKGDRSGKGISFVGDKKRKEKKGTFLSGWVASSRNKEDRRARMVGLSLRWFIPPTTAEPSAVRSNPPVISVEWRNSEVRPPRNCRTAATRLRGEGPDPLLEAAVRAAFLRFQESLRPGTWFFFRFASTQ